MEYCTERYAIRDGHIRFLQLIVPTVIRQEFIKHAHSGQTGGHFGVRRTQHQVNLMGYWMGWHRDVEEYCYDVLFALKYIEASCRDKVN